MAISLRNIDPRNRCRREHITDMGRTKRSEDKRENGIRVLQEDSGHLVEYPLCVHKWLRRGGHIREFDLVFYRAVADGGVGGS